MRRSYVASPRTGDHEGREVFAASKTNFRAIEVESRDDDNSDPPYIVRETPNKVTKSSNSSARTSIISELNQEREKCKIAQENVRGLEQYILQIKEKDTSSVSTKSTHLDDHQIILKIQLLEKENKKLLFENKKYKTNKKYADEENSSLKTMLGQTRHEITDLNHQNITLKAREAELSQKVHTVERFNNANDHNITMVNKKIVEYKEKIYTLECKEQDLKEKLMFMETREHDLHKKIKAFEKSKDGIEFVHTSMANEMNDCKQKIKLHTEREQDLIQKVQYLEKTLSDKSHEKINIQSELQISLEEIKNKESKWSNTVQEHKNNNQKLQKDLNKAKNESLLAVAKIEKKYNDATDETSMIKEYYEKQLKNAYEESNKIKPYFENLLKELHATVAEKKFEIDELETSLKECKEANDEERLDNQTHLAEIETLKSLLDANEHRFKACTNEINVLKSVNTMNENEMLSLRETKEENEQEIIKLQCENTDNKEKLDELKDAKMGLESKMSNLQYDLDMKATVNINLQKVIDSNNCRITDQTREIDMRTEELRTAKKEVQNKDVMIEELNEKIALKESFLGEEQESSQKLAFENAALRQELNAITKEMKALEFTGDNLTQSLEETLGKLYDTEHNLKTCAEQKQTLENDIKTLQHKGESENKANGVLRAHMQKLQNDIESNESQIRKFIDTIDEKTESQKDLQKLLDSCNDNLEEKSKEYDLLRQKHNKLVVGDEVMLQEIDEKEREIENIESDNLHLKAKLESVIMKYQKSEQVMKSLRNDLEDATHKIKDKEMKVEELELELDFTVDMHHKETSGNKLALEQLESSIEKKVKGVLLKAKEKRTQLIEVIEFLKAQVLELTDERSILKAEISDLQSKLHNVSNSKLLLESQLSDSKVSAVKSSKEIENTKSCTTSLRRVIKEKESKLTTLTEKLNYTTNTFKALIDKNKQILEDVEDSLFSANKKLHSFEVMFTNLSKELRTAKQAVDSKGKAVFVLRGLLSSCKQENKTLRVKLDGVADLENVESTINSSSSGGANLNYSNSSTNSSSSENITSREKLDGIADLENVKLTIDSSSSGATNLVNANSNTNSSSSDADNYHITRNIHGNSCKNKIISGQKQRDEKEEGTTMSDDQGYKDNIDKNSSSDKRSLLPSKSEEVLNLFAELEVSRAKPNYGDEYDDYLKMNNDTISRLKVKLEGLYHENNNIISSDESK